MGGTTTRIDGRPWLGASGRDVRADWRRPGGDFRGGAIGAEVHRVHDCAPLKILPLQGAPPGVLQLPAAARMPPDPTLLIVLTSNLINPPNYWFFSPEVSRNSSWLPISCWPPPPQAIPTSTQEPACMLWGCIIQRFAPSSCCVTFLEKCDTRVAGHAWLLDF